MIKYLTIFLAAIFSIINAQQTTVINYQQSNAIFRNPERGFSADSYSPLTQSFINSVKAQQISVIHRVYTIPQYRNVELPQSFLSVVENDLNAAREGGVKLVMRFSYTDNIDGQDAALDTILIHINQLQPILQANYDVIAYLEAGFIGAWGEWYYSTHNLNNTTDRRTVLFALLDALPVERCVVIRTPDYKRKIFQDNQPLTMAEAFNGSKKARTGAHNDCFLASATDYGTYLDNDIEGDKNYLNLDNRFVPQGGETCNPSSYSGCSNALTDLNRMHWSVLNIDYHPDVIQGWIDNGCMDEIKRRLGYRFSLLKSEIVDSVKPGGIFTLNFDIWNSGFANPYNPRGCEVILRNTSTKAKYRLITSVDPRFWFSGDTTSVSITGGIKTDMPEGEYEVLLFLPDTVKALHERKEYAIRFANENVWEDSTGYNKLLHNIIISSNVNGSDYAGTDFFELFSSGITPPDSNAEIIIDGDFGDWMNIPQLDAPPDDESEGDALNPSVDLTDVWVAGNSEDIYFSYKTAGEIQPQYFYHVFIDTDNDTSTGFHSEGSYGGFDFMIENTSLWKYAGTNGEWNWTYAGETVFEKGTTDNSRVELSVSLSQLEITSGGIIGIVFNINDNDENFNDDYAPDNYQMRNYEYTVTLTSVKNIAGKEIPEKYEIGAYPNPFNGIVNIVFNIPVKDIESATIYNIQGKKIITFNKNDILPGKIIWNARDSQQNELVSGIYLFQIKTKNRSIIKKLILIK